MRSSRGAAKERGGQERRPRVLFLGPVRRDRPGGHAERASHRERRPWRLRGAARACERRERRGTARPAARAVGNRAREECAFQASGDSGCGSGERPGEASSAFGIDIATDSPPAPPPPPPDARRRGHAQLTASAHGRQGSREEKQRRQQSSTAAAKAASTNRLAPCAVGSVQVRWLGGSSNQSRSLAHPSPPSPTPRQTSRVLCRRAGLRPGGGAWAVGALGRPALLARERSGACVCVCAPPTLNPNPYKLIAPMETCMESALAHPGDIDAHRSASISIAASGPAQREAGRPHACAAFIVSSTYARQLRCFILI